MALIICSECGKEISDKSNACIHCGNPILKKQKCRECGSEIQIDEIICSNCGYPFKDNAINADGKELKFEFKSLNNNSKIALVAGLVSVFFAYFILPQLIAMGFAIIQLINYNEDDKHNNRSALIGFGLGFVYFIIAIYQLQN